MPDIFCSVPCCLCFYWVENGKSGVPLVVLWGGGVGVLMVAWVRREDRT